MTSVLWAVVLATGSASAACDDGHVHNQSLAKELDAAVAAYESLDIEAFSTRIASATTSIPCLAEVVTPANAAQLHRLRGLDAFVTKEKEAARSSFAAARSIEPAYEFPVSMVPEGNSARVLYTERDPDDGAKVVLPYAAEGSVRLDGGNDLERNLALPVIFQRVDADGGVLESALVEPGVATPTYEVGKLPAEVRRNRRQRNTAIVGLSIVAAGGGIWAGSHLSRSSYNTSVAAGDFDAAKSKRGVTNALTIAAPVTAVAGLTLFAVPVLTGEF